MILILTEADQTPAKPITPEIAAKAGLPPEAAGKAYTEINDRAKAAAAYAETVWHRMPDGTVTMVKSRKGLPPGTPVTLFAVAELFGIKVNRDESADSAEQILKDILNAIDRNQPLQPFWADVFARAERVLNPSKS